MALNVWVTILFFISLLQNKQKKTKKYCGNISFGISVKAIKDYRLINLEEPMTLVDYKTMSNNNKLSGVQSYVTQICEMDKYKQLNY